MKLQKYKSKDPKKIGITIFTVVCTGTEETRLKIIRMEELT